MPGRAPSIRPFLFTSLFLAGGAGAEDLLQVYREAQRSDAVFTAARHTLEAGRERLPQGRALLLPTLNLSGSATRSAMTPFTPARAIRSRPGASASRRRARCCCRR